MFIVDNDYIHHGEFEPKNFLNTIYAAFQNIYSWLLGQDKFFSINIDFYIISQY